MTQPPISETNFDEFISAEVKEKEMNMTYDDMIRSRGKLHPVNKQTNMM